MLQHPDFQILKWTEKDIAATNESARLLGSPLEAGHYLYPDLQNSYKPHTHTNQCEDKPQKTKDSNEATAQTLHSIIPID